MKKIFKNKIYLFSIISILFFLLFAIGMFSNNNGRQSELFFQNSGDYMADFYNNVKYSCDNDPYDNDYLGLKEKPYLPLTYVILNPICKLSNFQETNTLLTSQSGTSFIYISLLITFVSILLFIQIFSYTKGSNTEKALLTLSLLLSGIFMFSFERGNIILLCVCCTLFFLFNYKNSNKIIREIAFISLAFAAGLKGYPAIFGLLLIYEKRYKDALRLIIYGFIFCFMPFLLLNGGVSNLEKWLRNISLNHEFYKYNILERFGYYYFLQFYNKEIIDKVLPIASIVNYIVMGIALISTFFQNDKYKKITLMSCIIILLPLTPCKYFALYLIPSVILLFNQNKWKNHYYLFLVIFILVFSPYQIFLQNKNITFLISNISIISLFLYLTIENIILMIKKLFVIFFNNRKKA